MVSGTLKHIPVEGTGELIEGYCPQLLSITCSPAARANRFCSLIKFGSTVAANLFYGLQSRFHRMFLALIWHILLHIVTKLRVEMGK